MVKIVEFHNSVDTTMPFDVEDDLVVFMRNDPEFYRKQFFPTMARISDLQKNKGGCNIRKQLMPMIEKGIVSYCKKFNLARHPDEIFHQQQRQGIADRIYEKERKCIDNGDYA